MLHKKASATTRRFTVIAVIFFAVLMLLSMDTTVSALPLTSSTCKIFTACSTVIDCGGTNCHSKMSCSFVGATPYKLCQFDNVIAFSSPVENIDEE